MPPTLIINIIDIIQFFFYSSLIHYYNFSILFLISKVNLGCHSFFDNKLIRLDELWLIKGTKVL